MADDPEEAEMHAKAEALAAIPRLAEKKKQPREHVMQAYQRSLALFGELYKKLAR